MTSTASFGRSAVPFCSWAISSSAACSEIVEYEGVPLLSDGFSRIVFRYCTRVVTNLTMGERSVMIDLVRFTLHRFHSQRIQVAMRFNLQCGC